MSNYHPSLFADQNDIYCYVCGSTQYVTRHEIFFGPYRQKSKEYGCWCNVCMKCHDKIHFGKDHSLDIKLKQKAQKRFEEIYSHEKFIEVFDKNRL